MLRTHTKHKSATATISIYSRSEGEEPIYSLYGEVVPTTGPATTILDGGVLKSSFMDNLPYSDLIHLLEYSLMFRIALEQGINKLGLDTSDVVCVSVLMKGHPPERIFSRASLVMQNRLAKALYGELFLVNTMEGTILPATGSRK
jgi:hypothetical protein